MCYLHAAEKNLTRCLKSGIIFCLQITSKGGNLNEILNNKPEHPLSALRSPLSALRSPLSALSLIAALFIPFNLQAEEAGGFLGFTIGQMDFDYDVPAQFRWAGISLDDRRVLAWKFLGGYHYNEYFGAEVAYVDARKLPLPARGVTLANLDLSGFTFAGVFRYPVTSQFNIFAKGGGFIWSAEAEWTNRTLTNIETDGVSYVVGAGAEFEVIENLSLRAEWERLDADGSIDFYSLGLLYNF